MTDSTRSLDLVGGQAVDAQRKAEVVAHAHMRVERVALQGQGHIAVVDGGVGDIGTVDEDGAGLRGLQTVEHPQDRRLARGGGAVEDEELAVIDEEIERVNGFGRRVLVDMTEAIQRHR
jgi:hypothetical protein